MWVTFALSEVWCWLNNHISALNNSSQESIHFKLGYNHLIVLWYHLFRKSKELGFITCISTAWEHMLFRSNWQNVEELFTISAYLYGTVSILCLSLDSPLEEVLGSLLSEEMRLSVSLVSTILSLSWVPWLWNIYELPCSWFQKFNNTSVSLNLKNIGWSLMFHSSKLVIREVLTCVKSATEIFLGLAIKLLGLLG